jgi:hypothetical protein
MTRSGKASRSATRAFADGGPAPSLAETAAGERRAWDPGRHCNGTGLAVDVLWEGCGVSNGQGDSAAFDGLSSKVGFGVGDFFADAATAGTACCSPLTPWALDF